MTGKQREKALTALKQASTDLSNAGDALARNVYRYEGGEAVESLLEEIVKLQERSEELQRTFALETPK